MNYTVVLLSVLALGLAGCSSKSPDQLGRIDGRRYVNEHFGIALALPDTWFLQSEDAKQIMRETGREAIAGDDRLMQAQLKQAAKNTFTIFMLMERELGAPGGPNPVLICMVERLTHLPGIKSAEDYLVAMRETLERSAMSVKFAGSPEKERINDIEFTSFILNQNAAGTEISQRFRVIFKSGYALALVTTYADDVSKTKLDDIVQKIESL